MKTIVKILFGSHLYGTNTENSDLDYKGVFIPDEKDILLQNVPNSIRDNTKVGNGKNTKDDIDCEMYSIHYFFKLLEEGQTVAMDMLFAPKSNIIETSYVWDYIERSREMFLSKNIKACMGICNNILNRYDF